MRLPIRTKIILASSVTVLIVTVFIGLLLRSEGRLETIMDDMIRQDIADMQAAEEIKYRFVLYDGLVFRYLATDDPTLLSESDRMRAKTLEWIRRMKNLKPGQAESDLLSELESELALYSRDVRTLIRTYHFQTPSQRRTILGLLRGIARERQELTPEEIRLAQRQAITVLSAEGLARLTRIYSLCDQLASISRVRLEEDQQRVRSTVAGTRYNALAAGSAVVVAVVLISVLLALNLLSPLQDLLQGVGRVTAGELGLQVPVQSADELGRLTEAFNAMTRNLREKQEQLIEESTTDPLTGLHNLRHFQAFLNKEIARAARYRHPLSLLLLDIDHFKHYNDTNGHQMGNIVLKQAADLLKSCLRSEELVARYGGEEFVVCLPETDEREARIAAERIRCAVEKASFPGEEKQPGGRLTISIGGASFPADGTIAQQLIERADQALYASKDAGRNRITWSESDGGPVSSAS